MSTNPAETCHATERSNPIDKLGQIVLGIESFEERLQSQQRPISQRQRKQLFGIAHQLLTFTSERLAGGMTRDMLASIRYLSMGYKDRETAELEDVGVDGIKIRRREAMKKLGAKTKSEAVVIAIQSGYIGFETEQAGDNLTLTPEENTMLTNLAHGRTAKEVSEIYGITIDTANTYEELLRKRLGAKNLTHAMRRAFELGIFKIGEPIPNPADDDLRLSIDGEELDLRGANITKPGEIELLKTLANLKAGLFQFNDLEDTDFYKALSDRGRRRLFGYVLAGLSKKIETAIGKPVIEKRRIRINGPQQYVFALRESLGIAFEDKDSFIPAFEGPIASPNEKFKKRSAQKVSKPVAKPAKKLQPKEIEKVTVLVQAKEIIKEPEVEVIADPETCLEPEDLPPIDLELLQSLDGRNEKEVLLNSAVKLSAERIAKNSAYKSYQESLILVLRYGISDLNISLNRRGKFIKISEIKDYIPFYQGLDIESTSKLSGLTPWGVLKSELKFILDFAKDFPALLELQPIIEKQMEQIKKQQMK